MNTAVATKPRKKKEHIRSMTKCMCDTAPLPVPFELKNHKGLIQFRGMRCDVCFEVLQWEKTSTLQSLNPAKKDDDAKNTKTEKSSKKAVKKDTVKSEDNSESQGHAEKALKGKVNDGATKQPVSAPDTVREPNALTWFQITESTCIDEERTIRFTCRTGTEKAYHFAASHQFDPKTFGILKPMNLVGKALIVEIISMGKNVPTKTKVVKLTSVEKAVAEYGGTLPAPETKEVTATEPVKEEQKKETPKAEVAVEETGWKKARLPIEEVIKDFEKERLNFRVKLKSGAVISIFAKREKDKLETVNVDAMKGQLLVIRFKDIKAGIPVNAVPENVVKAES